MEIKESLKQNITYIHNSHGVGEAHLGENEEESTINVVHSILCQFLVQVDDSNQQ